MHMGPLLRLLSSAFNCLKSEPRKRSLEKEIAALAAGVNYPTERISTVVLFGPVYQKVLAEAEEWGAEVVVVGSHRTGMDRFLIGSNAGAISTPRKVLSACRAVFASTAP